MPATNDRSNGSKRPAGDKGAARVRYTVKRSELPLYCPNENMPLWSAHPRVYLAIEKTGSAACPYCGTEYSLVD
ncbi:MAG: zinc-finger domain-containing protein [Chromatiales bacterium]|nr:zinc-finger domain-containing protein [Chromatiales bacterium]